MSNRTRVLLPITLAIVACTSLACGFITNKVTEKVSEEVAEKAIEKSIEADGGGDASVDMSNGQVNITTDQGAVNITANGGGSLPSDFPADVPLYPGAKITGTMSSSGPDGAGVVVNFETTDSADKIAAFYKEKLGGSFKTAAEMNMGGQLTLAFVSADEKRTVSVSANPTGSGSAVMLIASQK